MYIPVYMYIYIYRERERLCTERTCALENDTGVATRTSHGQLLSKIAPVGIRKMFANLEKQFPQSPAFPIDRRMPGQAA